MTYKELFDIIESERFKKGFSLVGLCTACGISKTQYRLYRNGTVNMGVIAMLKIFETLGIEINVGVKC